MKRDFDEWLSSFKSSISDYTYYVDFEKIYAKADKVKIELNILNSLVGSRNIRKDFENILIKYPETLECIPLLLAVRSREIFVVDGLNEYLFDFKKMVYSLEDYISFMEKSGLFNLLQNHIINNLYDYVLGIEVGLDSNARKNRGGHLMEDLVETHLIKAGFIKDETYFKEMNIKAIESKFNIDLSQISNKGKTVKRFDFVVYKNNTVYGIEANFYASGGSKLNETARSYKQIAIASNYIENFEFVWITDGQGWKTARNNLQETFEVLDNIFNINDLDKKFKIAI